MKEIILAQGKDQVYTESYFIQAATKLYKIGFLIWISLLGQKLLNLPENHKDYYEILIIPLLRENNHHQLVKLHIEVEEPLNNLSKIGAKKLKIDEPLSYLSRKTEKEIDYEEILNYLSTCNDLAPKILKKIPEKHDWKQGLGRKITEFKRIANKGYRIIAPSQELYSSSTLCMFLDSEVRRITISQKISTIIQDHHIRNSIHFSISENVKLLRVYTLERICIKLQKLLVENASFAYSPAYLGKLEHSNHLSI